MGRLAGADRGLAGGGTSTGSRSNSARSRSSEPIEPDDVPAPKATGCFGEVVAGADGVGGDGGLTGLGSSEMILRIEARISSIEGSPVFCVVCIAISVLTRAVRP